MLLMLASYLSVTVSPYDDVVAVVVVVQASLARLQLDYVDVLFCHRPDPNTPIEVIHETTHSQQHSSCH